MVELQPSKLVVRVRSPSPALHVRAYLRRSAPVFRPDRVTPRYPLFAAVSRSFAGRLRDQPRTSLQICARATLLAASPNSAEDRQDHHNHDNDPQPVRHLVLTSPRSFAHPNQLLVCLSPRMSEASRTACRSAPTSRSSVLPKRFQRGDPLSPYACVASEEAIPGPPVALHPGLYVRTLPVACAAQAARGPTLAP